MKNPTTDAFIRLSNEYVHSLIESYADFYRDVYGFNYKINYHFTGEFIILDEDKFLEFCLCYPELIKEIYEK